MGREKATIEVDGESMAARTAALLLSVSPMVVEVGPGHSSLPVVAEAHPGAGPLAAVADGWKALRAGDHDGPALVVATDLPRLTAGMLMWLADHPARTSVVPESAGRPQLLCARWSAPDLDRSVDLVAAGRRSMRDLLAGSGAVVAGESEWAGAAGGAGALDDADTPADLMRLGIGASRP